MQSRTIWALWCALVSIAVSGIGWAQTYTMPANDNYVSGSYRYAYGVYYYSVGMGKVGFGGMEYDSNTQNQTYYSTSSEVQTSWDYTNEAPGAIPEGTSSFEIALTACSRNTSSSYSYFFNSVWIDWDRDGQFNNVECVIDPVDGWNGGERYYPPHRNTYDNSSYGYYNWYYYAPWSLYNTRAATTYDIAVPPGMNPNDYRVRCRSWNEYYYQWYYNNYLRRYTPNCDGPYMTATSLNRNNYYGSSGNLYLNSETEDYTLTVYEQLQMQSTTVGNLWAGSSIPQTTLAASGGVGSYRYSFTDNSPDSTGSWVQIDANTGVLSGAAPASAGGDVIDLTLTVTDDADNTDSINVVFSVLAPIEYPHFSNFDDPANRPYFAIQGGESSGSFEAGQGDNASTGFVVTSTSNAGWNVVASVANDPAQWLGATATGRVSGQEVFFNAEGVTLGHVSFKYLIENTSNAANAANIGVVISTDGGFTWNSVGSPDADVNDLVYRTPTGGEFQEASIRFTLSGNQNTLGVRLLGLVRNDSSLTRVVIDDFSFEVPLSIQTTFLPGGQQECPYGPHELTAIGGQGSSITFAEDAANPLPAGLEIVESNGSWYIQGIPGAPATGFEERFGITVTDDVGGSHTLQYTIALTLPPAALSFETMANLPTTAKGVYTEWPLDATGGLDPLTWSIVSGPSWIDIDPSTGLLFGTPGFDKNSEVVRVKVQDAASRGQFRDSVTKDFTIGFTDKIQIDPTVFPNLPVIQLPNGEEAASYNQSIPLIGGTAPYAWSLAQGSGLPSGMALAEFNGFPFLTGTPFSNSNGIYAFDLVVTDAASYLPSDPEYVAGENSAGSQSLTLSFRISIGLKTASQLTILTTQSELPESIFEGESVELFVRANGGRPPYSFAPTGVGLPDFIDLSETGYMVIAPKAGDGGNYLIAFEVTDVASGRHVKNFNLSIGAPYNEPKISTATQLPNASISSAYALTFKVTGGQPPYTWSLVGSSDVNEDSLYEGGGLPIGMRFNPASAHVSGVPMVSNTEGTTQLTVNVTDAEGFLATKTFDLTLLPQSAPALTITSGTLVDARVKELYGLALTSSGGYGAHTWTLKPGSAPLPRGLSISEFGVISGTPLLKTTEPAEFTVQVSDGAGAMFEKQFNLNVLAASTATTGSTGTTPIQEGGVVGAGGGCSMGSSGSSGWLILIFAGLLGIAVQRRRQEG